MNIMAIKRVTVCLKSLGRRRTIHQKESDDNSSNHQCSNDTAQCDPEPPTFRFLWRRWCSIVSKTWWIERRCVASSRWRGRRRIRCLLRICPIGSKGLWQRSCIPRRCPGEDSWLVVCHTCPFISKTCISNAHHISWIQHTWDIRIKPLFLDEGAVAAS